MHVCVGVVNSAMAAHLGFKDLGLLWHDRRWQRRLAIWGWQRRQHKRGLSSRGSKSRRQGMSHALARMADLEPKLSPSIILTGSGMFWESSSGSLWTHFRHSA